MEAAVKVYICCIDSNKQPISNIDIKIEIDGMNYKTLKTDKVGEIKIEVMRFFKIKLQPCTQNYLPQTKEVNFNELEKNNYKLTLELSPKTNTTKTQLPVENKNIDNQKQDEKLKEYTELFTVFYEDFRISPGERKQLEKLRTKLDLSKKQTQAIEEKIIKHTKKKITAESFPLNNPKQKANQRVIKKTESKASSAPKNKKRIIIFLVLLIAITGTTLLLLNLGTAEYNYKALQKGYETKVKPVLEPTWDWNSHDYQNAETFIKNKQTQIEDIKKGKNTQFKITYNDSLKLEGNTLTQVLEKLSDLKLKAKQELTSEILQWTKGLDFNIKTTEQYIQDALVLEIEAPVKTELNQFLEKCKTIEKANKVLCKEITDEAEIEKIRKTIAKYFDKNKEYRKEIQEYAFHCYYGLVMSQMYAYRVKMELKEYIKNSYATLRKKTELINFYDDRENNPCRY